MELYIHRAEEKVLEVIDLQYPEYMFIFEDIDWIWSPEGRLMMTSNHSVKKSSLMDGKYNGVGDEDEFLDEHTQVVMKELLKCIAL